MHYRVKQAFKENRKTHSRGKKNTGATELKKIYIPLFRELGKEQL